MQKNRKRQGQALKIDRIQNQKIIDLIRAKLNPLHAKIKIFPRIKQSQTFTNGFCKKEKSPTQAFLMTQMIYRGVGNYPRIQQQQKDALLERVKNYITQQKKKNCFSKYQKRNLDPFIQLFSDQNGNFDDSDKKINLQFFSIRRQSLQNYINDYGSLDDSSQITHKQMTEAEDFSPAHVSLMNAKLRKKRNHKKMIDLHKIR